MRNKVAKVEAFCSAFQLRTQC